MAKINMVSQGKGGVDKSMIASLVEQFIINKNQDVLRIDTDRFS